MLALGNFLHKPIIERVSEEHVYLSVLSIAVLEIFEHEVD